MIFITGNPFAGIGTVLIYLSISVFVIFYGLRCLYLWYHRRRINIRRSVQQLPQRIIAIEALQFTSPDLPKTGLDPSVIAALPTFVYKKPNKIDGTGTGTGTSTGTTECSICLSTIEEEELVRLLPNCLHLFHAECIDMWLSSHTTCPICRAVAEPQAPPEPEQEPNEAQTHGTSDEVPPPTSPPLESLNSMTPSSEGASYETAQSSKVDASSSRPPSSHKILSWNRSGRRIQSLEISADGVEDLGRESYFHVISIS